VPAPSFLRRRVLLAFASFALGACSSSSSLPGPPSPPSNGTGGSTTTTTTTADAAAKPALRVLFVGNSYTFVNDLPGWVHRLGDSSGVAMVTVDSVAVPAATLADHVATTGAIDRIHEGGWTHVVLQGQSVEPLTDPASFEAAAATLAAEAKKVGAAPVFYETWARRAGDAVYQEAWSGGTPAAMQAGLRAEYQKVADAAGAAVAPVGDAREKALAELPAIDLFAADGSHPSVAGTYLAAGVFHATLTGHSPVGIADRPMELAAADASALQGVAEEMVGAPP
jgi:hypothetical protein